MSSFGVSLYSEKICIALYQSDLRQTHDASLQITTKAQSPCLQQNKQITLNQIPFCSIPLKLSPVASYFTQTRSVQNGGQTLQKQLLTQLEYQFLVFLINQTELTYHSLFVGFVLPRRASTSHAVRSHPNIVKRCSVIAPKWRVRLDDSKRTGDDNHCYG